MKYLGIAGGKMKLIAIPRIDVIAGCLAINENVLLVFDIILWLADYYYNHSLVDIDFMLCRS